MDKAVINGKTYILVPEEVYNEEKPDKEPERTRTGYERVEDGDEYFYYNVDDVDSTEDQHCEECYTRSFEDANYYNDEQLAKDNVRADSILRRMRQWQALNDVAVDIYNPNTEMYHIGWDIKKKNPFIGHIVINGTVENFEVYFSIKEKAEEALEVFRDDLIWLHTEYRRRLDEVRRDGKM